MDEIDDFSLEQAQSAIRDLQAKILISAVRSFLRGNYRGHPGYDCQAHPFLQGCDEEGGWVFIEFWTNDRARVEAYISALNEHVRSGA